jgi:four helix bundle protein
MLDVRYSMIDIQFGGGVASQPERPARVYELQDRLIDLCVRISEVCDSLPATRLGRHVTGQLVRCGTAAAPLYAEACAAESRRDFIHKLGLCLKELRETMTWLRYAQRLGIGDATAVDESIQGTDRAIAIVYTSIRTAKRNAGMKS